jgi:hypothetical protein
MKTRILCILTITGFFCFASALLMTLVLDMRNFFDALPAARLYVLMVEGALFSATMTSAFAARWYVLRWRCDL